MNPLSLKPDAQVKVRLVHAEDRTLLQSWQPSSQLESASIQSDPPDTLRWVATGPAGDVLASLALRPPVGLQQPRAWYHVGLAVHAAAELQLYKQQRTLMLGNNLTGHAELCDILWSPDPTQAAAAPGIEALAALSMLTQQAQAAAQAEPQRWGQGLIVELPGCLDDTRQSPFWQGLTQHFYRGDRAQALARCGSQWRQHLAALLPRQSVYASFLPEAAQAAIGQQHATWLTVRQLLQELGWVWRGHITIDDGAAVLEWQPPYRP